MRKRIKSVLPDKQKSELAHTKFKNIFRNKKSIYAEN